MDARNLFHTKWMYRIIRGEHLLVLAVSSTLAVLNYDQINWWHALIAFWSIDLIGYIPGAIAYRRSGGGIINRWFHRAYNIAHTYLVTGAAVGIWAYLGGFEWAMLAIPIHLSIDRGVFGNILKPTELSFEPKDHSDQQVLHAMGRGSEPSVESVSPNDVLEPEFSAESVAKLIDHPSGYLALSNRNRKFAIDEIPGFISYRQSGKHLWIFGGVHAASDQAGELLDRFLQHAQTKRRRVAAVQVRQSQVELFADRGFHVNQLGSTYAVALDEYNLRGRKKMQLRNKINKAKKAGVRVVEIGSDVPRDSATFAQLQNVSQQWIDSKGAKELDFMIGELGDIDDHDRRIFMAIDAENNPVAFISYVPVWDRKRPGYLHDLTRKIDASPTGTMELLNATAIEQFQQDGVAFLHFGFTPLIIDPEPSAKSSRWIHRLITLLRKHGKRVYPADSQAAYKTKWGTDVIEREYVAVRSLSLRAVVDFLLLTRSV